MLLVGEVGLKLVLSKGLRCPGALREAIPNPRFVFRRTDRLVYANIRP